MHRPAAAPPAPVQPPWPAQPQTTAIQLHAERPKPSTPPASAPPPQAGDEPRSWTSRAAVKRTPPSASESAAQPESPRPPRKADVPTPSRTATVSGEPAHPVTVDRSAQMHGERAATIDEESAHQASEPPLIASELNLHGDRGRDSSDDLLFVEEDFAQALPLPPELAGEEAEESQAPPPIVGLQVRPEDFAAVPAPPVHRPPLRRRSSFRGFVRKTSRLPRRRSAHRPPLCRRSSFRGFVRTTSRLPRRLSAHRPPLCRRSSFRRFVRKASRQPRRPPALRQRRPCARRRSPRWKPGRLNRPRCPSARRRRRKLPGRPKHRRPGSRSPDCASVRRISRMLSGRSPGAITPARCMPRCRNPCPMGSSICARRWPGQSRQCRRSCRSGSKKNQTCSI